MARVSVEQRRRDLTAIAVKLVIEEGRGAVTARRVAECAGTPLGTVHYAFRDMDELMESATIEVLGSIFRAVEDIPTDRGLRAYVGDALRGYWQWARENEGQALAFFEIFVGLLRSGKANTSVVDARHFLVERMREAERHDARPSKIPLEQVATLLTMAVDGMSLIHLARRDWQQTEEDLEQAVEALQQVV